MKKRCVIYGAGSVGKLASQILDDLKKKDLVDFEVIGFIDDDDSLHSELFCGLPVLGGISVIEQIQVSQVIVAFTDNNLRNKVFNNLEKSYPKLKFPSIIHPSVYMGKNVCIGKGVIVYPGVFIDPDVIIGDFCIINKLVTIGHDTVLKNFVTLSPGVNIGGFNRIENKVFFGISSSSLQFKNIGENTLIGAGAVVTKDLPANCTAVGVPAKPIQY